VRRLDGAWRAGEELAERDTALTRRFFAKLAFSSIHG
jgi:hypothetical protein